MIENLNPFANLDLKRAIALRWTLRDIRAKRFKLSPVADNDLHELMTLGLIELQDDTPVLTRAGDAALD